MKISSKYTNRDFAGKMTQRTFPEQETIPFIITREELEVQWD